MTTEIIYINSNSNSNKVSDWKIIFNDDEMITHRKGSPYFFVVNKEGTEAILCLIDLENIITALGKLKEITDDYRSN